MSEAFHYVDPDYLSFLISTIHLEVSVIRMEYFHVDLIISWYLKYQAIQNYCAYR